jgi:hypothetical protein
MGRRMATEDARQIKRWKAIREFYGSMTVGFAKSGGLMWPARHLWASIARSTDNSRNIRFASRPLHFSAMVTQ